METQTAPREIDTKIEVENLITACSDLNAACSETDTKYLVVGSVAVVCAVGKLYRIPGDVDGWYDIKKAEILKAKLEEKGYIHNAIEAPGSPFPYPLEHFEKDGSVIELRGANYTDRGIEYPVRLPVPGLSVNKRPLGQLVYTKSLAQPKESKFGNATVMTTSREALWVGLQTTLPLIQLTGDKVEKRLLDLSKLAENLDMETVKIMFAEKPGLYYGNIPLVTTENHGLFKLLTLAAKLKK